jgi:hypothetical protein
MSHPWQRWNQIGSAQDRPRSDRSRITTQVKIGMPVCFIYVIQRSLLQSLLLEKVRPDSASKASPMHNSAKETLCWTSFDERTETCTCSLVSYIEGLDIEKPMPNFVQRRITFSSANVWWTNPGTGVEMSVSLLPTYNKLTVGSNFQQRITKQMIVQENLTAQRHKDDILPPHNYAQCYW